MTNALYEAIIDRQQEKALQRKEHMMSEHKKRHKEKQENQELVQAVQDLQKEVKKLSKAIHKMMENPV